MKKLVKRIIRSHTGRWPERSRIFLIHDIPTWVIGREMIELRRLVGKLGFRVANPFLMGLSRGQAVFYGSQFFLLGDDWLRSGHFVGTAYFHGRPGTGYEAFDRLYERLCRHHERIDRIQVSHREMERIVLESGIAREKVHRIPIAVNLDLFHPAPRERRLEIRRRYGIPESASVIGSFHKDGSGWGEGREPKPIKGPDVLLRTLEILRTRLPDIHVLLTGPARGYVKSGLDDMSIPYTHLYVKSYERIGELYQALDTYLVPSRQEGGPKAVLEAMASGIPVVSTRVGQATDLVAHGENGFLVDVEDAEGLAFWTERVLRGIDDVPAVVARGRRTAEENSYRSQTDLWRKFMEGFVTR